MEKPSHSMSTEGQDAPALTDAQRAERQQRLDALGRSIADCRKEAIDGRSGSGIEQIWREDQEHYEGIDDKNRHLYAVADSKPLYQASPKVAGTESVEFPNITRPYVDAAAAKVGDILIPTDDRAWSIRETPIPELIQKAKGGLSIETIQGLASINAPEQVAVEVAKKEQESAQAMIQEAREKAERAQKRIEDWHTEGQWHAEMRKVIDDAARIGTGVLKGPVPVLKRQQMFADGELVIREEKKPVSKRIDPWNCFPDPACGDNPQNGRYHFERDYLTKKQLVALRDDDSYIAEQINACLEEGPAQRGETRQTADGRTLDDKDLFEVWYYYGFLTREDLESAGCPCGEATVMIPAIITVINERVVKAALNPLDSGEFPYDYFPWQARSNSPWGFGVSRQIRTPQRIVVAATRVMLTNAGRAAGPILVLKNGVYGADGTNDITPWKLFYVNPSDTQDDVNKVAALLQIPALTKELMEIVQYGMKLAEDVTGLPLLLQGQRGSAPETLGGQQLVDRNASGVLRRIARTIDDRITEPHIRRYYAYLLLYGDEDIEKGEFVIDARGSTTLVDRELYKQETAQLLEASLNPAFGLDPKKTMAENLRANNRRPEDFQYSEEDQKKMEQAQSQQQPDARAQASIQVATVRADTEKAKAQANAQETQAEIAFKQSEAEKQRRHDLAMADRQERIEILKLAAANRDTVANIKAELAGKVMTLRTQERLASAKAPQVATPAVEPPGRAPAGEAFQR